MRTLLVLSVVLSAISAGAKSPRSEPDARTLIAGADKLIVVTTKDWDFVHGKLQRYERKQGVWKKVGERVEIVVGKNGMGWTPMLPKDETAPAKREGDGKSQEERRSAGIVGRSRRPIRERRSRQLGPTGESLRRQGELSPKHRPGVARTAPGCRSTLCNQVG